MGVKTKNVREGKAGPVLPKYDGPPTLLSECAPLQDRLVVRLDTPVDVTKGGILLPGSAQEKPQVGTVISAGPGKPHPADPDRVVPMRLKVGDRVLFSRWSGTSVEGGAVKDDMHLILREDDVLATLPGGVG